MCLVALWLLQPVPGTGQERASVSGSVFDAFSGEVLSSVELSVEVEGQLVQLEAPGRFRISGLWIGPEVLSFSREGYVETAQSLELDTDLVRQLQIPLARLSASQMG